MSVETTQDMYDAVMDAFPTVDIVIKAAAVADYRPKQIAAQKIKKNRKPIFIEYPLYNFFFIKSNIPPAISEPTVSSAAITAQSRSVPSTP